MSATCCPHLAKVCPVEPKVYGLIAEFDVVGDVRHAAQEARNAGYAKIDVHSSFPIHGIDAVLGIKPTILPWMCLVMGLIGMTTGIFLTTYCMADWIPHAPGMPVNFEGYTFIISGKPMLAIPAYVPPIFELTIMFSAYTAVFGMFLLNRLPTLSHPLFSSDRFRRATQDRLFLAIETEDAAECAKAADFLKNQHGVLSVEQVYDCETTPSKTLYAAGEAPAASAGPAELSGIAFLPDSFAPQAPVAPVVAPVAAPVQAAPAQADAAQVSEVSLISGVGDILAQKLERIGIRKLAQIAAWTPVDIFRIESQLGLKGHVLREQWIEQAKEILAGKPPRASKDRRNQSHE